MAENIDPVEVKFTADTSGLAAGASTASNSVKDALEKINSSVVGMGQSITNNTAVSGQAMQGMASTISGAMQGVTSSLSSVLLPITLLIGAWETLGGAVKSSTEEADEVRGLMNSFGLASDKASELNVSLKLLGVSSESYTSMALKLDRQVRSNEQGLEKLGVTTRDSNGHLLDQQSLMASAVSTMMSYQAGTDRNAASMALFGRNSQEAYKLQYLNNEAMERGAEVARRFGEVLSGEALEGARAYQLKMNELNVVWDSFKEKLGDVLMPVLVQFAELMIQIATAILPAVQFALKYVTIALEVYTAYSQAFVSVVTTGFELVSIAARMFADVVSHALKFDGQVTATWQKGLDNMKNLTLKGALDIKNIWSQLQSDLAKLGSPDTTPMMPAGGNKLYNHQDKKTPTKTPSRMPEFEDEFNQAKLLYAQEHQLREMGKADELAFWLTIKQTHKLSKEEMLQVDKVIANDILAIYKKTLKDQEALTKEEIDSKQKDGLTKIKIAEEVSKAEVESGKKTKIQNLGDQVDFENQRYAIEQTAQAARIALAELDPDNPVEKQKQLDKVLEIYRAHELALAKIQTDTVKTTVAANNAMLAPITQAISGTVQGMLQGTQTLEGGIKRILQSIIASYISSLATIGQHWLAEQMGEFNVTKTFTMLKEALFGTSAATTTATKATEATAVVGANAAEGASGAAASVASIPFTGWALAAGVFASTMAMILGAKSAISASGGFDVPFGVNPMTQLHSREMVLPASQADVIRNMANNGGGNAPNIHLNVTAMDGESVAKFFAKNKAQLSKALAQASRNGVQLNPMRTS